MPAESETSQSYETLDGYQRRTKCDIRGEDIKKWRDAVIVLKNNCIYVYKNEAAKTPQLWIGLDKCLVMTAAEFEGKNNVIQLKTFTGRIFCFALPSEEDISAWVKDIKESDYTSIKEKVSTLEQGLQAIGLAQDAKAKEDREKMVLQNKQQSLYALRKVRESIHNTLALQVFMKWKMTCDNAALVEDLKKTHETTLQSVTEQTKQQIAALEQSLQSAEAQTKSQIQALNDECTLKTHQAALFRLNLLLEKQHNQRVNSAFYQWRDKIFSKDMASKSELLQKEIQALQSQLETIQQEFAGAEQMHAQREAQAMKEKEEMQKKHEEEAQFYENLTKEHTAMKEHFDEIVTKKAEVEERNNALSLQLEQMAVSLTTFQEAAGGSESDVQAIVARLQMQVNDLTTRLHGSQKEEEEYRRKWEMLQEFSVDELARAQQKIDELTATCSELIKQVEEANNNERVNELLGEVELLKEEKEKLNQKISNLNLQIRATEDVVTNSSTIAMERASEMKEMEDKLLSTSEELKTTREQKEQLEKELASEKEENAKIVEDLKKTNETQKDELTKLKRRVLALKNMEENMQDVEDQLEQRERQLKDVLERIKKAEKNSEECKKEVKRYEALNAELEHRMANYTFREGQAGEVLEKTVEVFIDRPETLERVSELEGQIEELNKTIEEYKNAIMKKEAEEQKHLEENATFKSMKMLPMKFFPMYPTTIPTETKGPKELPETMEIKVEEIELEKEPIKKYEGRNPDVVRREEEERRRKEEEERQRREEEERQRREEEERKRREEEERKRKEEEERKRREEEERKRREEEERKRREEEERQRREEEERKRREEEERQRREEEERQKQEQEAAPASNPFAEEEERHATPNPFDEVQEEERHPSPNPFDNVEEERHTSPNPFDNVEEERHTSPNPFDNVEEERHTSPNPFDNVEEERHPSPNPFDNVEEERHTSPNPFDNVEEERQPSPNPFDNVEEERHTSPNPFDTVEEERHTSPNPFDEVQEEERQPSPNPFDTVEERQPSPNPFDTVEEERQPSPNPFDTVANPFAPVQEEPSLIPEEKPTSPNPFDAPEEAVTETNPWATMQESNPFAEESASFTQQPVAQTQANPFAEDSNPFAEETNPFAEPEPQANPFAEQPAMETQPSFFGEESNPFGEPEQQPPFESQPNPFAEEADPFNQPTAAPIDLTSFMNEDVPKQEKKSLWKSISTSMTKNQDNANFVNTEEAKRKWGFSDKQKDAIKGGMGRFSNMIKSASKNIQLKKKVEEPAEFPDVESQDLMLGMKAKAVQYFFANWNYDDDEKKRFYEWVEVVVENQGLTESHISGFTVENGTFFAEGAFRMCIVPLLNMRENVNVDFSEIPAENGSFTLSLRVSNKADPLDDLLSGFYYCLLTNTSFKPEMKETFPFH